MIVNETMDANNCSNTSNISGTVEEYLRHLQDNTNITMIPAVIMLAIFAITGFIGNILVLVVYSQKMKLNPTAVLIMTIATFDLIANVAALPSEVNIMFDSWNFKNAGVCKSKVLLGSFTTGGGAISLVVVAVIRYRKVCRPYGWQVTIKQAKIASIVTAIFAFILSIPYVIIYGIRTRETPCPKIQGTECFADDSYFYTIWPLLNNLLFIVLFATLSISLIVLYVSIGVTAWKHRKRHGVSGQLQIRKRKSGNTARQPSNIKNEFPQTDCNHDKLEQDEQPKSESRISAAPTLHIYFSDTDTSEEVSETTMSEVISSEIGNFSPTTLKTTTQETASREATVYELDLARREVASTSGSRLSVKEISSLKPDTANLIDNTPQRDSSDNQPNKERETNNNDAIKEENGTHFEGSNMNLTSNDDDKRNILNISDDLDQKKRKRKSGQENKQTTIKRPVSSRMESRNKAIGRTTAMLFIISAFFVFGYFPFLILTIYKNRQSEAYARLGSAALSVYNLFYRLYFINSAVNPFIYSLYNVSFRRECFRLLSCSKRCLNKA